MKTIIAVLLSLTLLNGPSYGARDFNGTTQAASTASAIDLSAVNAVSVSLWLWIDTYGNEDKMLIELGNDYTNFNSAFVVDVFAQNVVEPALLGNNGTNGADYDFTAFATGTWHHLVFIFDKSQAGSSAGEVDLYVNGSLQSKTPFASVDNSNNFGSHTFYVMARGAASNFIDGRIADVAIWKSRLSGGNVTSLNGGTLPNAISPAADFYWKLCGDASPEPATSGGINLTLANAPTKVSHPGTIAASCASAAKPRRPLVIQ